MQTASRRSLAAAHAWDKDHTGSEDSFSAHRIRNTESKIQIKCRRPSSKRRRIVCRHIIKQNEQQIRGSNYVDYRLPENLFRWETGYPLSFPFSTCVIEICSSLSSWLPDKKMSSGKFSDLRSRSVFQFLCVTHFCRRPEFRTWPGTLVTLTLIIGVECFSLVQRLYQFYDFLSSRSLARNIYVYVHIYVCGATGRTTG